MMDIYFALITLIIYMLGILLTLSVFTMSNATKTSKLSRRWQLTLTVVWPITWVASLGKELVVYISKDAIGTVKDWIETPTPDERE